MTVALPGAYCARAKRVLICPIGVVAPAIMAGNTREFVLNPIMAEVREFDVDPQLTSSTLRMAVMPPSATATPEILRVATPEVLA